MMAAWALLMAMASAPAAHQGGLTEQALAQATARPAPATRLPANAVFIDREGRPVTLAAMQGGRPLVLLFLGPVLLLLEGLDVARSRRGPRLREELGPPSHQFRDGDDGRRPGLRGVQVVSDERIEQPLADGGSQLVDSKGRRRRHRCTVESHLQIQLQLPVRVCHFLLTCARRLHILSKPPQYRSHDLLQDFAFLFR